MTQPLPPNLPEQYKIVVDTVSISTVVLTFLTTWMPPLAAMASLIWALIRIWETDTVQRIFKRKK